MKIIKLNNRKSGQFIFFAFVGLLAVTLYFLLMPTKQSNSALKLGWQPPWINQGQIVEVLKHSGILEKYNVQIEYKPFTYGGPMTEAALAGDLDILFAGDQPAITLLSKDDNWRIVARMTNYRSAIMVPINSPLKSIDDLKGKKLAAAVGSTTYRDAIRELLDVKIDFKKDMQLVNLDQAEHALIISSNDTNWNGIDAIATYDPTIAIGINKGKARILKEWISPSVVLVNKDVLKNHRTEIENFLKSYSEAFNLYQNSPSKYNKLYGLESRLPLQDSTYFDMAEMEPNMTGRQIDIRNSTDRKKLLIANAQLAFKVGIIKKPVNLEIYFEDLQVDTKY